MEVDDTFNALGPEKKEEIVASVKRWLAGISFIQGFVPPGLELRRIELVFCVDGVEARVVKFVKKGE